MGNKLQKMWKKEIIASVEATSTCITIAGICTSGTCKEKKNGTFDIAFQRERERERGWFDPVILLIFNLFLIMFIII